MYPQQVAVDTKLGELCCHSEGPQQAGEMGWQEPYAIQQGEVLSPALAEEQPCAPVYAGG